MSIICYYINRLICKDVCICIYAYVNIYIYIHMFVYESFAIIASNDTFSAVLNLIVVFEYNGFYIASF